MDKDKFETWWDGCYKLPPGVSINDHFRQEYEVRFDDLISDNFCINTPSEPNISVLGDASGYVLTSNGADCEWTVVSNHQPTNVCFYDSSGENSLTIDFDTGDVKLSAKMTIDEAAKLFWDKVMEMNPIASRIQLEAIEDRLVEKINDYFNSVVIPEIDNRVGTKVEFLPSGEDLKTPEQIALEAYTPLAGPRGTVGACGGPVGKLATETPEQAYERAMKVVE